MTSCEHVRRHVLRLAPAAVSALAILAGCGGGTDATAPPTSDGTTGHPAGTVLTDFGVRRDDSALAVAIQNDGLIIVAGTSGARMVVARYRPDGHLDATFGAGGKVIVDASSEGQLGTDAAVQVDGRILVGATTLVRLTDAGRLDPTFGRGGRLRTRFGEAFALQRDARIVVVGGANDGRSGHFAVARYMPNGQPDASFGSGGLAATPRFGRPEAEPASDYAEAIAVQPDGKLLAAGTALNCGACGASRFALARFSADGQLDEGFGAHGAVAVDFAQQAGVTAIVQQQDGRIVAAGYWYDYGSPFARYGTDGRLDDSFGDSGVQVDMVTSVEALAVQPDDRILLAGSDEGDFGLVRYLPGGRIDRTFGMGGRATTGFGRGRADVANAIAVQPDGKIVVVGSSKWHDEAGEFAIARYLANGRLDPAFGIGRAPR